MNSITRDSLEPPASRWLLVGAALAVLFVAAVVILAVHARPAGEAHDEVGAVDNGL